MAVKDDLLKKVPDFVKATPEWTVFLKWLSQNEIETRDQLIAVLNEQIKFYQDFVTKNQEGSREGTNTRKVREYAKTLDFLKLAKEKIVKYV
ncbi:MAG: hypothetical protein QW165_00345 [Candidatus Woesearchaeota archaeon]